MAMILPNMNPATGAGVPNMNMNMNIAAGPAALPANAPMPNAKRNSNGRKWGIIAAVGAITMVAIAILSNPTAMPKPVQIETPKPMPKPFMAKVGGREFDLRATCIRTVSEGLPLARSPLGWTELSRIKPEDVLEVWGYGSGDGIKGVSTWLSGTRVDLRCGMKLTKEALAKVKAEIHADTAISLDFFYPHPPEVAAQKNERGLDIEALLEFYA